MPTRPPQKRVEIAQEPVAEILTAPVLYFDEIPLCGLQEGMARMTLSTWIDVYEAGTGVRRQRAVAHLKFPVQQIKTLRAALDGIETMLTGPQGTVN